MKKLFLSSLLVLATASANAGVISVQSSFSDVSDWQLNGTAAQNGNRLALTSTTWQSGTAFLTDAVNLSNDVSFSAFFQFEITNPTGTFDRGTDTLQGADGIAFVVQTNSNDVGSSGGGIGYAGVQNSVIVEFDTWNNGASDNNSGNHVGINLNGSTSSVALAPEADPFNVGGIWSAWIDYDGVNDLLEVRWSDTGTRSALAGLSYNVDLTGVLNNTNAFFGFTSGTGTAGGLHEILAYEFRDDFSPVVQEASAPATLGMLLLGGLALMRQRCK
ncbi:L-type lectin-domain containing protein [Glaciecola sp. 1036]|uniref:L-type lectin-domain containing protein n=1 Tax=Alteromonadaceae TaxID=72275 RepID=UPI003D031F96